MHIATKFRVLAVVSLVLAVLLMMFQFNAGGDSQKLLQDVRTMPAWIFYGFTLVVLALFAFMFKIFYWDLPRAGSGTKSSAEQVAKRQWYVKGASIFGRKTAQWLDSKGWSEIEYGGDKADEGAAVLKLSSTDRKRQELTLPIRPGHPSAKALRRLSYLDVVEFDFVEKPLECALDTELCAYLVLKPS